MNNRDYQGLRQLDPQCEPEYAPVWEVICYSCCCIYTVEGSGPVACPICGETDLDALNIREVTT